METTSLAVSIFSFLISALTFFLAIRKKDSSCFTSDVDYRRQEFPRSILIKSIKGEMFNVLIKSNEPGFVIFSTKAGGKPELIQAKPEEKFCFISNIEEYTLLEFRVGKGNSAKIYLKYEDRYNNRYIQKILRNEKGTRLSKRKHLNFWNIQLNN